MKDEVYVNQNFYRRTSVRQRRLQRIFQPDLLRIYGKYGMKKPFREKVRGKKAMDERERNGRGSLERRRFPEWRGKRPGFRATAREYREYVKAGHFVGLMHRGTPLEIQDFCYSRMRKWWRLQEPLETLWYDLSKLFPPLRGLGRFASRRWNALTHKYWWLTGYGRTKHKEEQKSVKIRTEMTAVGCFAGQGPIDQKYLAKLLKRKGD
jgi:hypothetical protein